MACCCVYTVEKLLNVMLKMLLFCSRLQVIHVSPFFHLHVDLIPFLTYSFNYIGQCFHYVMREMKNQCW